MPTNDNTFKKLQNGKWTGILLAHSGDARARNENSQSCTRIICYDVSPNPLLIA